MSELKKTLVIGGSENPERYSFKAITMLREYNHPVVSIGLKEGQVQDVKIQKEQPDFKDIDTVSLYLGEKNQASYIDYILNLNPKRIIFNPGTENPFFIEKARQKNIDCLEACTLVLLRSNQF